MKYTSNKPLPRIHGYFRIDLLDYEYERHLERGGEPMVCPFFPKEVYNKVDQIINDKQWKLYWLILNAVDSCFPTPPNEEWYEEWG